MRRKKILHDPGFWILTGTNLYLVYHYYHHPEIFSTLIWLYWSQSVLLGIFNFFDMLTVRKVKPASLTVNGKTNSDTNTMKGPGAFFFLFHYGFFHFVYFFFVGTMTISGTFDPDFFKYFFFAFLAGQIITFIQHKIQQRKTRTDMTAMFFIPYLRIIPMHLTILLPAFLHISNMGIFLLLKAIADVGMYAVTKPGLSSRESDAALLASQQTLNM